MLIDQIEAYGKAMSEGKKKRAKKELDAIFAALDDRGLDQFELFWEGIFAPLIAAGAKAPELRTLSETLWLTSRQSMARGRDFKVEATPEYLAKVEAARARRGKAAEAEAPRAQAPAPVSDARAKKSVRSASKTNAASGAVKKAAPATRKTAFAAKKAASVSNKSAGKKAGKKAASAK